MLFLLILSLVIVASVAALFSPYIFVRILGGIVLGVILYIVCLIFWPVIKMSPRLLSAILFMNGMFTLDAILCQTMLGFWRTWNSIFVKLGFPEEHEELRGWYTQIASNSVMLGEFEKASSMNRKCLEIAMRDGTVADVGEARVNLAYILLKTGELEESSQLMKKGLADVEREYNRHVRELDDVQDDFSRNSDDEEAYMLETGVTVAKLDLEQIKLRLYTCLYSYGDFLETFLLFDKAVEVRKRAFEIARDCFPEGQKGLEYALTQLGICLARVGDLEEAEKRIKEGFELRKNLYDKMSSAYSHGLFSLGLLEHTKGNLDEAERLFDEHIDVFYKLPRVYRIDEGYYLTYYAAIKRDRNKLDEAGEIFKKALAHKHKLYGDFHPDLVETYIEYEKLLRIEKGRGEEADKIKEKIDNMLAETRKQAGLE